MDVRLNLNVTTLQSHRLAAALNHATRRTAPLIPNEQDIGIRPVQEGLEIVQDATACAHSAASHHDSRKIASSQIVERRFVLVVITNSRQVFEDQWLFVVSQYSLRLLVPEWLQVLVDFCKPRCQRRVDDDIDRFHQTAPFRLLNAFEDAIHLVEQLLRTAQAKRGNDRDSLIIERFSQNRFKRLLPAIATVVDLVAVRRLENQ